MYPDNQFHIQCVKAAIKKKTITTNISFSQQSNAIELAKKHHV